MYMRTRSVSNLGSSGPSALSIGQFIDSLILDSRSNGWTGMSGDSLGACPLNSNGAGLGSHETISGSEKNNGTYKDSSCEYKSCTAVAHYSWQGKFTSDPTLEHGWMLLGSDFDDWLH